MNRPWLTASLIGTIAVFGALGLRNAAHRQLERGLSTFTAALPPDVRFTYRNASPGLLSRSVTLHDVSLQRGPLTLRASVLEFEHLQSTPDGGISLRKLFLRTPTLQNAEIIAGADSLTASHVIFPPTNFTGDLSALDFAHVALASGHADHITIHSIQPQSPITGTVTFLGVDALSVSDLGPTRTGTITLQNLQGIAIQPMHTALATTPSQPGQFSARSLSFTGPDPITDTRADRRKPGTYTAHITAFKYASQSLNTRIDDTALTETVTPTTTDDRATLTGLHLHAPDHIKFPKIDGQHATLVYLQHDGAPKTTASARLTIPSFMTATLDAALAPQPGQPHPDALETVTFTLQGDRLINTIAQNLTQLPTTDPNFTAVWSGTVASIMKLLPPTPASAEIARYLVAPSGRTLTVSVTPSTPLTTDVLNSARNDPATTRLILDTLTTSAFIK